MISFIVMASGLARRFGDNKLLSDLNGKPVAEHILSKLSSISGLNYEKILVYRNEELRELGEKYGFKTVENTEYEKGQSESIKAGVKSASNDSEGYMFFVADQPFVSCETVKKIAEAGTENKDSIVIPFTKIPEPNDSSRIKRGNPVFFPLDLKCQLLELEGDSGGREVIRNNEDRMVLFEIDNILEFYDIDTKEDLINAEKMLKNNEKLGKQKNSFSS